MTRPLRTGGGKAVFRTIRRFLLPCCLLLCHMAAVGYAAGSQPDPEGRRRVRIAEFVNPPSVQLLFMQLGRRFAEIAPPAPAWQTLPWETPAEREELRKASVLAVYDAFFTADEELLSAIERQDGLLRRSTIVFCEELILVGPTQRADVLASQTATEILRAIGEGDLHFYSLIANPWVERQEALLWERAGMADVRKNKNYVESGHDDISALILAGDENAFLLVPEGSYAQYLGAQRDLPMLTKLCGTGLYRQYAFSLLAHAGFRKERAAAADKYADWLTGGDGRTFIENFQIGDIRPFRSSPR